MELIAEELSAFYLKHVDLANRIRDVDQILEVSFYFVGSITEIYPVTESI